MTVRDCAREAEVAAAARRGWLSAQDQDVRQHVSQCAVCARVAHVCEALVADQKAVRMFLVDNPLPSAGQVWRRAALRAQADGVQAASRPLVWAQGVAAAVVVGLAIAALGAVWPALTEAFGRVGSGLMPPSHVADGALRLLGSVVPGRWAIVVGGVAACVAVSPAVVYWALRDERRP